MGLWERHIWKDAMYIIYNYIYICIITIYRHMFLKCINSTTLPFVFHVQESCEIYSVLTPFPKLYMVYTTTLWCQMSLFQVTQNYAFIFACIEGQRANVCRGQNLFEIWPNRNVPGRVQLASGLYYGSVICYCVWIFSSSPIRPDIGYIIFTHLKTFWN